MLTTEEAQIHLGCEFAQKRGEFLLVSVTFNTDWTTMTLIPKVDDGSEDMVIDVPTENLAEPMWSLVQCNFPSEHGI